MEFFFFNVMNISTGVITITYLIVLGLQLTIILIID